MNPLEEEKRETKKEEPENFGNYMTEDDPWWEAHWKREERGTAMARRLGVITEADIENDEKPFNYLQDYGPSQKPIYRRGSRGTELGLKLGVITEADIED